MDYQTAIQATENSPVFFSVSFQAPGRPLSGVRRMHVRLRVRQTIHEVAARHGFIIEPASVASDPENIEFAGPADDLKALCDLQETLVKEAAGRLHADVLGGANVTRLDVMCGAEFSCISYDEALDIVNARGHDLSHVGEMTPAAMETLVHYCGDLPVHVFTESGDAALVLPLAGEVGHAALRSNGEGRVKLDLTRTMQYFMGLGSSLDATSD